MRGYLCFDLNRTFRYGHQTVHVVHPAPAHTDGDSVIYFEAENVVHSGDIHLNKASPVADPSGSLDRHHQGAGRNSRAIAADTGESVGVDCDVAV